MVKIKLHGRLSMWGIDPGISGALCHFDSTEGFVEVFDMPILETNGKKHVDPWALCRFLKQHESSAVWIERVGARPGQGVVSMFNFGRSYGTLIGAVTALEMQLNYVTPQEWQRKVKMQSGKDGSRTRASELMPAYAHLFARKKDDGRSDAALIAFYGFCFGSNVDSND